MNPDRVVLHLLLLACNAVSGCSLKDRFVKAGEADASAEIVAPPSAALAPSAAAAAPSVTPAGTAPGPAVKSATSVAAATKDRYAVPTCPKGLLPGTIAMSPFKAFCGAPCKTHADCKGVYCTDVNALAPNAPQQYIKICDPEAVKEQDAPTDKPSAAASGKPAATKCGPNEHFDGINKKCRPFGDCPDGYRWNDGTISGA
jgi:hypothetical protein